MFLGQALKYMEKRANGSWRGIKHAERVERPGSEDIEEKQQRQRAELRADLEEKLLLIDSSLRF